MSAQEVLEFMTWLQITLKVVLFLFALVSGFAAAIPALKKAWKKRKDAETAEAKAQADLEIKQELQLLVSNVETEYKNLDKAMKSIGSSAGPLKKNKVLSDLRDFCDEKGYEFDKAKLSEDVDNFVRITKEVNYK